MECEINFMLRPILYTVAAISSEKSTVSRLEKTLEIQLNKARQVCIHTVC